MSEFVKFASVELTKSNYDLVFVTAAELSLIAGLQASQVFEPAVYMAKQGHDVTWLSAVPLFSYLKDTVLRTGKIRAVQDRCASEGIHFKYVVTPLTIGSPWAFMIRDLVLRWAAKKLLNHLQLLEGRKIIFHARSYYAAHLACEIKSKARLEDIWRVSFDMRSVLPEEFPLTQGWLGKACFGFAKQWEHELLGESDVSFLPLNYARDRMQKESGHAVIFAPIQGFDREASWTVDFDQRWSNRYIGYAGSLGAWHDPTLLLEILQGIPNAHPKLAMSPHPQLEGLDCTMYKHHEMTGYYDSLLALVIPGRKDFEEYFVSFKMRCNFFTTKAAEALSRGVPLIVSSELTELADFVRQHGCGAIYDPNIHHIIYPAGEWLENKNEWYRLTENAMQVGEQFTRSSVMQLYLSKWNALFETPAGDTN